MSKKPAVKREESRAAKRLAELAALEKKNGGRLTIEICQRFVNANKKSALAQSLLWDNASAGDKFRASQLQAFIREYRVFVTVERNTKTQEYDVSVSRAGTGTEVPGYQSVPLDEGGRQYEPTITVMSDADKREMLLRDTIARLQAIREIALFPRELGAVALAIQVAAEKYGTSNISAGVGKRKSPGKGAEQGVGAQV